MATNYFAGRFSHTLQLQLRSSSLLLWLTHTLNPSLGQRSEDDITSLGVRSVVRLKLVLFPTDKRLALDKELHSLLVPADLKNLDLDLTETLNYELDRWVGESFLQSYQVWPVSNRQ